MHNRVWSAIEREGVSSVLTPEGTVSFNDPYRFKGLSADTLEYVNNIQENHCKTKFKKLSGGKIETLRQMRERSAEIVPLIINNYKTPRPLLSTLSAAGVTMGATSDSPIQRAVSYPGVNAYYGMDYRGGVNNLWIGQTDAAAVYAQKGLPELIIRKKSHSILLNGVRIKNPLLAPKQIDQISRDIDRYQFDLCIANAIRDSLIYGGSLLYPKFRDDNPLTFSLSVHNLIRHGILNKGTIDYFTTLDRWNVVHTPNWNPTSKDFEHPPFYFIPFLGAELNAERAARIVTSPQAGYWGTILTLGWGVTDFIGWLPAIEDYNNVMKSVPIMIQQMSILARQLDTTGMSLVEGASLLDMVEEGNSLRMRDTTPDNIVNIDVVGELTAIKRDFAQVPELIRLMRQDAASKAWYPEELIWSSERGAFSSGDTTDSAFEKQTETTRYTHMEVARQLKNLAMIFVVNSLGVSDELIKALPYTSIEFDNPRISNAKDKADIAGKIGRQIFDTVSAGYSIDAATSMAEQLSDYELRLSDELMAGLRKRQKNSDERAQEQHDLEMELLEAQIDQIRKQTEFVGVAPAGGSSGGSSGGASSGGAKKPTTPSKSSSGGGHSYADRLEQRKHEKIKDGGRQSQALQKAQNKQA
jgi:hypothetical protein